MIDLISRKAVIDAIVNAPSKVDDNKRDGAAFRQLEIIDIIETLPPSPLMSALFYGMRPAFPESYKSFDNSLISREAAIEAVYQALKMPSHCETWQRVRDALMQIPSDITWNVVRTMGNTEEDETNYNE